MGDPNTVTIDVANGIAARGKAVWIENASIRPIAIALLLLPLGRQDLEIGVMPG